MRGYKNFESDPHPGDLRHLLEIGYTENRVNENGYPEPTDIVLCRAWAAVTDAGNQHYRAADVMNTEAVINFTIRYRADITPGTSLLTGDVQTVDIMDGHTPVKGVDYWTEEDIASLNTKLLQG